MCEEAERSDLDMIISVDYLKQVLEEILPPHHIFVGIEEVVGLLSLVEEF